MRSSSAGGGRRLLAAGIAFLALGLFGGVARVGSAAEGQGFTVDDKHLNPKRDYPPIPGQNPSAQVEDPTLDDCKLLPSDVAVPIKFAIKNTTPTKAVFTVTWPAADANDVDIYFYNGKGEQISDAATGDHPETFQLGGLPNDTYWLCVRNFSGVNAGFTIEVKVTFVDLFVPPPPPPTPKPSDAPPAKLSTPAPASTVAPTPVVTPEAVETPGPDGATREQELLAVSGKRQASPQDTGRSGLSIGLLAVSGVIIATGAGLVFVRIRRDTKIT